jgi:hypothetical protein
MANTDYSRLALQYAPVFAQKVSREWPAADQIASADIAGGMTNVAENPSEIYKIKEEDESKQAFPAKVYYSVCETTTHYFLLYAVYHVLDWWKRYKPKNLYDVIRDKLDEHVHDMEGALLVVTKEPKELIDGLITIAHNNFYLYSEPMIPIDEKKVRRKDTFNLHVAKFNETVDGHIWLDKATERVKLYIESHGHGIRGDNKHWGGGDEIWYYGPREDAARPGTLDRKETVRKVTYELEDIFAAGGLWDHRFVRSVFRQNKEGKWAFVYKDKNDTLRAGAANPPWSWNDHNDPSPMGEIATDPAKVIIRYAQGWGPVSTCYAYNPYQSIGTAG